MNSKNYLVIGAIAVVVILGIVFVSRGNLFSPPTPEQTLPPADESALQDSSNEATSDAVVAKSMVIDLAEQNDSGESGTASLEEVDGRVMVTINITGAPAGVAQPAHIHEGACPEVGAVKYPLTNVVDGKSETALDVDMKTLLSGLPLGLNVHKSAAQSKIYVACGDLKS